MSEAETNGAAELRFDEPLVPGRLIRRYKRFLADVVLDDGREVTAHCPNSGSMATCVGEGWPVRLSRATNPRRKLRHTLEMIHNGATWIGVHTNRPNELVDRAVAVGAVPELAGYAERRREVPYGERSRIDLRLADPERGGCWVEVKNVTLIDGAGYVTFPDAVTKRGQKHLRELTAIAEAGERAVMFFLVQRGDAPRFRPADEIDAEYGRLLREAVAAGVEVLCYRAEVAPERIALAEALPVDLP